MQQVNRHLRKFGKAALAVSLIGLVLLLGAMVASPSLHKRIHHDADKADHECVITLFSHGQVDSANGDVPPIVPIVWVETSLPTELSVFSATIENLPSGRAPPLPA
ncbi:MAG: hypothetical protein WDM76_10905 [Limisphaerales bacterium]